MPKVAKHISFSGRVQGVGFRFTAQKVAMHYKLAGYVCNTPNGGVEVLAQGGAEDISAFVRDLQEMFTVQGTTIEDAPVSPRYDGFDITF